MSVFHSYDIRGLYPEQITPSFAYKLACAYADQYLPKTMVVAHDTRNGTKQITQSLVDGFIDSGVKVTTIGLATTPQFYFAINHFNTDGGIIVTASHNPKEYLGFKICKEKAIPIGYDTGLDKLEKRMQTMAFPRTPEVKGELHTKSVHKEYLDFLLPFASSIQPIKAAFDPGNGTIGVVLPYLLENIEMDSQIIHEKPNGNFPNRSPNPFEPEALKKIQAYVHEQNAQIGFAYDGDGDRVVVLDEHGDVIPPSATFLMICGSLIDSQIAQEELFLHDLRMSAFVPEWLKSKGFSTDVTRVGHTHIKTAMRKTNAICAGEQSGHYYFRDAFYTDNALLATIHILRYVSVRHQPVSQLVEELIRYESSGEVNLRVNDTKRAISVVEDSFVQAKKVLKLDGISLYFDDHWFNVRASNTEPLLRINVEADDEQILEKTLHQLKDLLHDC
ncbi:MAG: phosphomannomutase/phosphoglucomutase [Candidatus Woesearchaeota archaeon]